MLFLLAALVTQEALQLPREIVACGEVSWPLICLRVEPVLEHPHVGGEVRVLGDGCGDLLLVRGGAALKVGGVHVHPEKAREAIQQGESCRGRGYGREVVRHRSPEADRRQAGLGARAVQDAGYARRALVARGGEPQRLNQGRVLGVGGYRNRARVRHVGEQSSHSDDELHVELPGQLDHRRAERAPPEARLRPGEQDGAAPAEGLEARRGRGEMVLRPLDGARDPLDQLYLRPGRLVVEELFRVEGPEVPGLPTVPQRRKRDARCFRRVIPTRESGDQNRPFQLRPPLQTYVSVVHEASLSRTASEPPQTKLQSRASACSRRLRYSRSGISTAPRLARWEFCIWQSRSVKPLLLRRSTRWTRHTFEASGMRLNIDSPMNAPPRVTP